ncbi:hypothetical protein L1987_16880 [Smallanthus sonchifolius]|uniref:Uncharacterized protein n=1 Tax=Smallanthus sonchifolius TaxID=185202 RepID=A0ACB9IWW1_9ASTR|nr:hypothetical protein L1987_16880 [Smallanthus sonchifolius]
MGVSSPSYQACNKTVSSLSSQVESSHGRCVNITSERLESLMSFCGKMYVFEVEETYGEPMVWIGIYITIASWFCILAMLANVLNGLKRKKIWFPCKYFSLNATSVTVITVAMKLPMDLSGGMPGYIDQAAKLGSMAFMCMMMTNLMPSLASMDNKALAANVIGLVILVITMIVNVSIEISTGVIYHDHIINMAYMYIIITILLLMILISSAITIPTCKQILEMKYQATSQKALNDQQPQHASMPIVEKLRRYVRRYWVMAETGSPQFVMASNPLSFASGVICVVGVDIYISLVLPILLIQHEREYGSQYKSTTLSILITQSIGVMVGAIIPILRCYMVLRWRILMILKVEEYWTQKLYEWKESDIPFLSSDPRSRALVHKLKKIILNLWIMFQKVIVVSCKMMVILVVYCSYCWRSLRVMFSTTSIASSSDNTNEDVSGYVLQLEDAIRPTQETLISISKSLNHFMQKDENKQSSNLLNLLEKSTGFEGVKNFDNDQVQLLFSPRLVNTWSLPVVSLTCIAITLPNIRKGAAHSLLTSVREGLSYTRMVEECLNTASEYVDILRATITLWREVEDGYKWLENTLETRAFKQKTPVEILTWFVDKAQEIVTEITNKSFNGERVHNPPKKFIAANSMNRISQTILFNHQGSIGLISNEELFGLICGMIADILAACLTNIPRVIMMKFNESAIDKSEASVEAAAKLLGRTSEIITRLEVRQVPIMDQNKMAFIDERRLHLNQP